MLNLIKKVKENLGLSVLILILLSVVHPQERSRTPNRIYNIGDWITYRNCNYVTSVCESPEYVFFGTSGGILPFHKFRKSFEEPITRSDGLADDFISCLYYDKSTGYLWACHEAGVSYRNPSDRRWNNISTQELSLSRLERLVRIGGDNHYIWAQLRSGGFLKLDKLTGMWAGKEEVSGDGVKWGVVSYEHLYSFGSFTMEGNYQCFSDGTVVDPMLRKFYVSVLYINPSGNVFGGLSGGGLLLGDENVKLLRVHEFGPLDNNVSTFAFLNGNVYMGGNSNISNLASNRKGISCFNTTENTWQYFESEFTLEIRNGIINKISVNPDFMAVGTSQGVALYNFKKGFWQLRNVDRFLPSNNVTSIALNDTLLFAGTDYGLLVFSIPEFVPVHKTSILPVYTRVNDMVFSGDTLWVATNNGLYAIEDYGEKIHHFDMYLTKIDPAEPVAFSVNAIEVGDHGIIFSKRNSLCQYDFRNGKLLELSDIAEIKNKYIFDIKSNGNYICVGTNDGAFLIRINDGYYEHLTMADGLGGIAVYEVDFYKDYLWFATDGGLTKFRWRKYYE